MPLACRLRADPLTTLVRTAANAPPVRKPRMLTVNKLIARGRGLAPALVRRAATVSLDWATRQKGHFEATDSSGRQLGVSLPRGSAVRGGDVLVAEDGSLVRVEAAAQAVLVVRHCTEHGTPGDLLRAAYLLGSRHVAVRLKPDQLELEPDPVLADLLRRMHLIVTEESSAFEPQPDTHEEGGGAHEHEHHHERGHHHGHAHHHHEHEHRHHHGPAQAHEHSHDRGHHDHRHPGRGHHAQDPSHEHGHEHRSHQHGHAKPAR